MGIVTLQSKRIAHHSVRAQLLRTDTRSPLFIRAAAFSRCFFPTQPMAVPTAYAQPIAPVPASMAQEKQDPRIAAYHTKFPQMVPAADVDAASVEARFRAGKTVPLAEALGYAAQLPSEQRTNE